MSQPNPVINTYGEFCYWNAVYEVSSKRLGDINAEVQAIQQRPFLQRLRALGRLRQLKKEQAWRRKYHRQIVDAVMRYEGRMYQELDRELNQAWIIFFASLA